MRIKTKEPLEATYPFIPVRLLLITLPADISFFLQKPPMYLNNLDNEKGKGEFSALMMRTVFFIDGDIYSLTYTALSSSPSMHIAI